MVDCRASPRKTHFFIPHATNAPLLAVRAEMIFFDIISHSTDEYFAGDDLRWRQKTVEARERTAGTSNKPVAAKLPHRSWLATAILSTTPISSRCALISGTGAIHIAQMRLHRADPRQAKGTPTLVTPLSRQKALYSRPLANKTCFKACVQCDLSLDVCEPGRVRAGVVVGVAGEPMHFGRGRHERPPLTRAKNTGQICYSFSSSSCTNCCMTVYIYLAIMYRKASAAPTP